MCVLAEALGYLYCMGESIPNNGNDYTLGIYYGGLIRKIYTSLYPHVGHAFLCHNEY